MSEPNNKPSCVNCSSVWQKNGSTNCLSEPETGPNRPGYCPSSEYSEIVDKSFAVYRGDGFDARLAKVAAKVEGLCYQSVPGSDVVNARWTRVEDTVALAKMMGFKKIGIATCVGLLTETESLVKILQAQGFEAFSACCKAGSTDKMELGLEEANKIRPNSFEPACNPIAQAQIMNHEGMEMNIIMGLCVGHDMLFSKYSDAPVTTLVVKDRVTGHNPVVTLYGQGFYFKRLQKQQVEVPEE